MDQPPFAFAGRRQFESSGDKSVDRDLSMLVLNLASISEWGF